ncbi:hypothetical protein GTU79_20060 [Sodalis ligni]|uniref:hypothetical protein n=1 Tax=Sodalis ligni TaxID=2697027 RepID=UPI001BDF427B|nr:hypothetical protein [Sodalis ligni]QWA09618.1 hypothetical protein GTU79_20060 [Sodalis ligni]
MSINLLLKQIGEAPFWRRGIEQPEDIARHARERIAEYDIRTPGVDTPSANYPAAIFRKRCWPGNSAARPGW